MLYDERIHRAHTHTHIYTVNKGSHIHRNESERKKTTIITNNCMNAKNINYGMFKYCIMGHDPFSHTRVYAISFEILAQLIFAQTHHVWIKRSARSQAEKGMKSVKTRQIQRKSLIFYCHVKQLYMTGGVFVWLESIKYSRNVGVWYNNVSVR